MIERDEKGNSSDKPLILRCSYASRLSRAARDSREHYGAPLSLVSPVSLFSVSSYARPSR